MLLSLIPKSLKLQCSRGAAGATLVVCRAPDDDAGSEAASEAEDDEGVEEQPEAPNGAAAGAMQLCKHTHMQRGGVLKRGCAAAKRSLIADVRDAHTLLLKFAPRCAVQSHQRESPDVHTWY